MGMGMRIEIICLSFLLLLASILRESNAAAHNEGIYIVYMGSSVSKNGGPRNDHALLLSSLTKREKNSVVHTYSKGFAGFAARLSEEEARSIAERPGVVSVFPDPVLQLHTTRSWDFLKYQTAVKIDSSSPADASSNSDTIIGIIDTGIWPEAQSFIDDGIPEIPARWKGKCMEGRNFTSSNCNRKVIGARYYDDPNSLYKPFKTPRDESGHGTHVSSTAAGVAVSGASYYGLANGTAAGGSPSSRIAMYRVCIPTGGCLGSAILKAFDDAIADEVDVLSLSLGSSPSMPDFSTDPISIGSFHAIEKGIIVVCSAGNSGPSSSTVTNVAPWILTVAATTIDRDFQADVVLGGKKVIKGGGINFSNVNKSTNYPLIDGLSARNASSDNREDNARNCVPSSLDGAKVKGKIVLCGNKDTAYEPSQKFAFLKSQGAEGMILIDNNARQIATNYKTSLIAAVTEEDGSEILSYINSTSNPTAEIRPTVIIPNYKPAPVVGYFSSRGPIIGLKNLLKPDIAAPGVAILAAWPSGTAPLPGMKEASLFNIISGTSMACPHVSGLAAAVKSQHPTWSPSAIRSAIMTTAIQTNNLREPITTNTGSRATPYDIGAGEISVSGPLQPGLVYETESLDYLHFLCNIGYNLDKINNIATSLPSNFSCPTSSGPDSISDMNYPSITVSGLRQNVSRAVSRTVSNVGEQDSSYTAVVESPSNLEVEVVPSELKFSKDVTKLSFQVKFKVSAPSKEDLFGSITWTSDKFKVRSPFVVSKYQ